MRTHTILLTLTLASALAFSASKDRDWKTGRVLDSAVREDSYVTGSTTSGSDSATASSIGNTTTARGESSSSTTVHRVTVQSNELMIVGGEYLYIIQDTKRKGPLLVAIANRKHGCRFIVGEDIKYSQEKGNLWVLDVDGKECKIPILRQQRREAAKGRVVLPGSARLYRIARPGR